MSILTSVKGGKIAIDLKRLEDYTKTVLKKHDDLKDILPGEFKNVPPVVWFGDVEDERDRVLVISANPHNPEKCIESAKYCNNEEINKDYSSYAGELIRDYNNYFCGVYSKKWFNSIEAFLNGLDASFFDKKYKHQAIHIDLLPFATEKHFKKIADNLMAIEELPEWIDKHIRELINLINPKLIIINGKTNFKYFNQCVNLGAQPYKVSNYSVENKSEITIWKSCNKPLIATSVNLGNNIYSYSELQSVAEKLKGKLNF